MTQYSRADVIRPSSTSWNRRDLVDSTPDWFVGMRLAAGEERLRRLLIKTGTNAVLIATLVVVMSTACGGSSSHKFRFRTYDPLGYVKVQVTESDVLRRSAHAAREPGGLWSLNFRLTDEGQAKFRRLTRALAKRGARLHRPLAVRHRNEWNAVVTLHRRLQDSPRRLDAKGLTRAAARPGLRRSRRS